MLSSCFGVVPQARYMCLCYIDVLSISFWAGVGITMDWDIWPLCAGQQQHSCDCWCGRCIYCASLPNGVMIHCSWITQELFKNYTSCNVFYSQMCDLHQYGFILWKCCWWQGLSSHSTVLSGLLAFIITYASPFLFMLGMLLLTCRVPIKNGECFDSGSAGLCKVWLLEALAVPCILPLTLNGVILVAFTVILTLMQDHLFVWSVFSPK